MDAPRPDTDPGSLAPPPGHESAATLIVAIDGPSGAGKSSVSRAVADRLGLRYLDTGAMYRAVTWWMLRHGVDVDDPGAVAQHAAAPVLTVGTDPLDPTIAVDGVDVTGRIRGPDVTGAVSAVSAVPLLRRRMAQQQRDIVGKGGIVVEGRDIGTVVAPDAPVKVFLTAAAGTRAERRSAELSTEPARILESTRRDITRRDTLDSSRASSPLVKAADAVEVDATHRSLDEVVATVLGLVSSRVGVG